MDELNKRLEEFGETMNEATKGLVEICKQIAEMLNPMADALIDAVNSLEPYQRYELLHPQKKPRGSIRRKRKKRYEPYMNIVPITDDRPKKPIEYIDNDGDMDGRHIVRIWYCCPTCGSRVDIGDDCECGQIIDWN